MSFLGMSTHFVFIRLFTFSICISIVVLVWNIWWIFSLLNNRHIFFFSWKSKSICYTEVYKWLKFGSNFKSVLCILSDCFILFDVSKYFFLILSLFTAECTGLLNGIWP